MISPARHDQSGVSISILNIDIKSINLQQLQSYLCETICCCVMMKLLLCYGEVAPSRDILYCTIEASLHQRGHSKNALVIDVRTVACNDFFYSRFDALLGGDVLWSLALPHLSRGDSL